MERGRIREVPWHCGPLWKPLCYAQTEGLTVTIFITLLSLPVFRAIFVLDLKMEQLGNDWEPRGRSGKQRREQRLSTKHDTPGESTMTNTTNRQQDAALGYLLLRATIGTNICIHGVTRLLAGPSHFADKLVPAFQNTLLPAGLVRLFGLALPWAESIVGLLVLVGFGTRLALVAGSLLILTLTFGATLNQDWENAGLALIYATVYASLLAFRDHNTFSADGLLQKDPSTAEELPMRSLLK